MSQQEMPLTVEGYEKLKMELAHLETEKREQVRERVKKARAFCDFHEDSEYEAALTEQEQLNNRILEIERLLKHAEIIKETSVETVMLGSTVTIQEIADHGEETYTLVSEVEADPFANKISNLSPLGQALMGAKVNEKISVETPGGLREMKVIHFR